MITHQLSLKGKAAADVAEVAKHLNITYDVRDAENAGGIGYLLSNLNFDSALSLSQS